VSKTAEEETIEFEEDTSLPEPKVINIYGDIAEENTQELLGGLLHYHYSKEGTMGEDGEVLVLPIDFYIATGGGNVAEMFAIYDVMRLVREETPIHTIGIGKVLSAGVLLLAAGTKGERRIGKHCRLMLHRVLTGESGSLHNIQASVKEAEIMEYMMFEALVEETNLTMKQVKKIVSKNLDAYFSAEEAVEMGIADIIV
jgi:ATP-dependent Clp endopeptidase proteolytic subunit ClpP